MLIDLSKIITNLIQQNIEKVIKGIYIKGKTKYKKAVIDSGKAFESYLKGAVNKFSKIKSILYDYRPVNLYKFYVHVDIKCGSEVINTKRIENLLEYNKKITILGTGGTGKSTLLKHLFLNTIENTSLIPIFLELKDINKKNIDSDSYKLEDFIYESMVNLNFPLDKELFIKSLNSGNYIIFFDAFDELLLDKKGFVFDEIERITNKYGDNYYIVSSRPNEMLEWGGWNNFYNFTIQPLDKEQSIKLITNLDFDEDIKNKFLFLLKENKLFETYSSFCSNPFLLTLMLLTYGEFAEIPTKLHVFYERTFDVLYAKHGASKRLFEQRKQIERNGLSQNDFERILSIFSALSYQDSKFSFTRKELMEYINKAKEVSKEDLVEDFKSDEFKTDLIESVCIFIKDGTNYRFQHRSFQEYFTALYIYNLGYEDRQEFLMDLFEKKANTLVQDSVFDMLFEMDKSKLEDDFLIPVLTELKGLISNPNKEMMAFKFLTLFVDKVHLKIGTQKIQGEEIHSISGRFKFLNNHTNNSIKYRHLIHFTERKYVNDLKSWSEKSLSIAEKSKIFKEIYERRAGEEAYNFDDLSKLNFFNFRVHKDKPTKEDLKDILFVGSSTVKQLFTSFLVLEKLQRKYNTLKMSRRHFRPK